MQPCPDLRPVAANETTSAAPSTASSAITPPIIAFSRGRSGRSDWACAGGRISIRAESRVRALLLGLDELAFEHLAGRVARQLIDEHDLARDLVVGEVVLHVVL